MIRAVIFDCFGVLATDIWLAFCDALPKGADLQSASDSLKAYDRGMITLDEFTQQVTAATGQQPPDIEQMQVNQMAKNTALIDYIRTLKPHYKIGMLSNISSDWVTRELLDHEEASLFDAFVFSYEVGVSKPDPRIYQIACERLAIEPDEAVIIDDRQLNVAAGESIGMRGLVYTDLKQCQTTLDSMLNLNS